MGENVPSHVLGGMNHTRSAHAANSFKLDMVKMQLPRGSAIQVSAGMGHMT
jgi:hypothetical protein